MEHFALETLRPCPICSSERHENALDVIDHSVSKESFKLVDCSNCGFRFTNPRPESRDIGTYYEGFDYISHTNSKTTLTDKLYHLSRKYALRWKYRLLNKYQPSGKVLDLGCGTGEFLAYLMSRGYQVEGVEPNLRAREQVIANYGIPVVPDIGLIPLQEQYQIITLWHVLEHIPDLRDQFKKLYALIAEGGLLVIAVPDRESWDAQHYGSDWAGWDVPRHLSHFRRQDVKRLIHEHGFELVDIKEMWLDALYVSMLSEQYRGAGSSTALIKGGVIGKWSNFISMTSKRPTSSTLYVARKTVA